MGRRETWRHRSGKAEGRRQAVTPGSLPRALFGAALALLVGVLPVAAHQPWFNPGSPDPDQPFVLSTPIEVSQVVYADLEAPESVDFYAFTAPVGLPLEMNLVVADDPACAAFRPAFIVTGPGVIASATPVAGAPILRPATLPSLVEDGVIIMGSRWTSSYEPFSDTTYLSGPEFAQTLAGGDYLVAVFDPEGGRGNYGLTLGGEEVRGGDRENFEANFAAWNRCEPLPISATPTN